MWWRERGERIVGPDLLPPARWTARHGPYVGCPVAGTSYYQEALGYLHRHVGDAPVTLALYPEPDNPHDANAVAVIAAGHHIGYLKREYARLWHPIVRWEHWAGRVVLGLGELRAGSWGTWVRAWFTQPAPGPRDEPPSGPPHVVGRADRHHFWAARDLTHDELWQRRLEDRKRSRGESIEARLRDEWIVDALNSRRWNVDTRHAVALLQAYEGGRRPGQRAMTKLERTLFHYIAQIPLPYVFYPQFPFGDNWLLDFYCPISRLAVEVDGPEHRRSPNRERDEYRDDWFHQRGIATYRVTNQEVQRNPVATSEKVFKRLCKRERVLVHTNPDSPYYGWRPRPPLVPASSRDS
ncbi:DUF559 domain-containing protein [Spiractinospora alimapuensis]|uniref:DUF559 domain-containing protein n=1 Tax=Spiractinospora alimapuensis TaxID=2820884 RepID=UPI001F261526|nr:DUF559 domain-containing protein [Spiractinospora alimapuensis]QVQ51237.1 DUF559 domain-containing protein [Spiractinospora alimapuensis]